MIEIKTLIKFYDIYIVCRFFILFLLFSCSQKIVGPNYNQGNSHNERKHNRYSIVLKEDARSKKQMSKTKKRASREIGGRFHLKSKHRRIIR